IASCPHCGAILLRTPRVLVHPMSGERDRIQRTLGRFWFIHAHTRFDGRIHRCPGRERAELAADKAHRRLAPTSQAAGSSDHNASRPWSSRGEPLGLCMLALALSLMASAPATAQDESSRAYFRKGEPAPRAERPRAGRGSAPRGDLSAILDVSSDLQGLD